MEQQTETTPTPPPLTPPEQNSPVANTPEEPKTVSFSSLSEEEQLDALAQMNQNQDPQDSEKTEQPEKPEKDNIDNIDNTNIPETNKTEEPKFEVVVDGKKQFVTQQELINGYMRQSDYSRKTQELARLREEAKSSTQNNLPNQENQENSGKKNESLQDALTQITEQRLGLAPGEFNPYDDAHQFARQQVLLEFRERQKEDTTLRQDVRNFVEQAEKDPLTPEIDKHFDQLLYAAAAQDPSVRPLIHKVFQAKEALKNNTLTREQANLLAAHWQFTKKFVESHHPPTPPTTPTTPPTTLPTKNNVQKSGSRKTLRSLSHDDDAQLDYLESLGVFK